MMNMNRNVRKRTFGRVCAAKIQIIQRICAVWSESSLKHMKNLSILRCPKERPVKILIRLRGRAGWSESSQWAHNNTMTSYQRRCDVITSHRRWYDVILTLCAHWVRCVLMWKIRFLTLRLILINYEPEELSAVTWVFPFPCSNLLQLL